MNNSWKAEEVRLLKLIEVEYMFCVESQDAYF